MSELESKLAELAKEFTVNSSGHISNPGKFEGESLAAPYYYEMFLDGGDTIFEITPEESKAFGWDEAYKYVYLEETNDGFIYVCLFFSLDAAEDHRMLYEGWDDESGDIEFM